jgi:hypothetical protein
MNVVVKGIGALAVMCVLAACSTEDKDSPSELCEKDCGQAERCDGDSYDMCYSACVTELSEMEDEEPAACWNAFVDLINCTSELSCADVELFRAGDPAGTEDYPCKSEDIAADESCAP